MCLLNFEDPTSGQGPTHHQPVKCGAMIFKTRAQEVLTDFNSRAEDGRVIINPGRSLSILYLLTFY